MTLRVLIRHSTGSKAGAVEEYPVVAGSELTFGREPSCDVRFDKDRDEFVSRRHMKLVVGPDLTAFTILDLSARNGTFVNRRRVRGSAPIRAGEIVQLGAGGPEFVFDVAHADLQVTPVSEVAALDDALPPRLEPERPAPVEAVEPPAVAPSVKPPRPAPRRAKPVSTGKRIAGAAAVVLVLVAAAAYVTGTGGASPLGKIADVASAAVERGRDLLRSESPLRPDEIAARYAGAVLRIEHAWKLVDTAGGRPIRQIYIPNRSDAGGGALVPGAGESLPVFVLMGKNSVQPLLTVAADPAYRPIDGTRRGAGAAATADGLILTTRSVTEPWNVPYEWPATDSAGVVVTFDRGGKLARTAVIARRQFPRWAPVETGFVLDEAFDPNAVVAAGRLRGSGRSESVVVRGSGGEMPAAVEGGSGADGFSAIRVKGEQPANLAPVADSAPKAGDRLIFVAPGGVGGSATVTDVRSDGRYALTADVDGLGPGVPLFDVRGGVVAIMSDDAAAPIRRALESAGGKRRD